MLLHCSCGRSSSLLLCRQDTMWEWIWHISTAWNYLKLWQLAQWVYKSVVKSDIQYIKLFIFKMANHFSVYMALHALTCESSPLCYCDKKHTLIISSSSRQNDCHQLTDSTNTSMCCNCTLTNSSNYESPYFFRLPSLFFTFQNFRPLSQNASHFIYASVCVKGTALCVIFFPLLSWVHFQWNKPGKFPLQLTYWFIIKAPRERQWPMQMLLS